jgi:hypothetical protein
MAAHSASRFAISAVIVGDRTPSASAATQIADLHLEFFPPLSHALHFEADAG